MTGFPGRDHLQKGRRVQVLRFEQGSLIDGLENQGSNSLIGLRGMNIHFGQVGYHTEITGFIQQGSHRLPPVNQINRRNIRIIVIAGGHQPGIDGIERRQISELPAHRILNVQERFHPANQRLSQKDGKDWWIAFVDFSNKVEVRT